MFLSCCACSFRSAQRVTFLCSNAKKYLNPPGISSIMVISDMHYKVCFLTPQKDDVNKSNCPTKQASPFSPPETKPRRLEVARSARSWRWQWPSSSNHL